MSDLHTMSCIVTNRLKHIENQNSSNTRKMFSTFHFNTLLTPVPSIEGGYEKLTMKIYS